MYWISKLFCSCNHKRPWSTLAKSQSIRYLGYHFVSFVHSYSSIERRHIYIVHIWLLQRKTFSIQITWKPKKLLKVLFGVTLVIWYAEQIVQLVNDNTNVYCSQCFENKELKLCKDIVSTTNLVHHLRDAHSAQYPFSQMNMLPFRISGAPAYYLYVEIDGCSASQAFVTGTRKCEQNYSCSLH
jgi:hypothetical protein